VAKAADYVNGSLFTGIQTEDLAEYNIEYPVHPKTVTQWLSEYSFT